MYPIGSGPSVSIVSPVATISRFHEIIFQVPKSAAVSAIALPSNDFVSTLPPKSDIRVAIRGVRFGPIADIDGLCVKSIRKEWLVPASHFAILFRLISGGEQCQRFPVAAFAGQYATSAMPNHWVQQFATAPTVKKCLARHSR